MMNLMIEHVIVTFGSFCILCSACIWISHSIPSTLLNCYGSMKSFESYATMSEYLV